MRPTLDHRRARLLLGVFWIYPLLWVLGVQAFSWFVVAAALTPALLSQRARLRLPPGFGLWLLFLGWVVVSTVTLTETDRLEAALFRGSCYLAATVFMVFLFNVSERILPTRTLVLAVVALWAWSIGLALAALVLPHVEFSSPFELVLPSSITAVPFVEALVHPRLGISDAVVGVTRPTPLYQYTNTWGAVVGLLTPIVAYCIGLLQTRRARLALAAALLVSLIPAIVSINRGLWISLIVAAGWVLLRRLARGDLKSLVVGGLASVAAATLVFVTPLLGIVQERFAKPNAGTRETLYEAALRVAGDSPILGYGSPVSSAGLYNSNDASIGTHGQFWTVLVSQGWPGAIFFSGFLIAMIVLTWRVSDNGLWLQGALVCAFVQIFFYDLLPVGVCVYAVALALCLRECAARRPPTQRAVPA